jgi:endonuclease/exonuclease/phosphatase family metal-dependent hydrolase
MLDAGYADGFRRQYPDTKGYTFPTWDPHVRLDYVFVPEVFLKRLSNCEVVTVPAAVQASDHFPLLAQIDLDSN